MTGEFKAGSGRGGTAPASTWPSIVRPTRDSIIEYGEPQTRDMRRAKAALLRRKKRKTKGKAND